MSGVLFYGGVVGFCLGIIASLLFDVSLLVAVWCGVVALGLVLVGRRREPSSLSVAVLHGVVVMVLCTFAIGIVRGDMAITDTPDSTWYDRVDTEVVLEGVVVREPDVSERSQHVYVAVDKEIILAYVDRADRVAYGDAVIVSGTLDQPAAFATDLGRTFDYPGYLKARNVNFVMSFAEIDVTDIGQGSPVLAALLSFKHRLMESIETHLTEPAAGLGEGLLLGVKQALGDELETVFRRTGIIHIVVLSGYNVSLVVIFFMYVLSYALPYRARLIVGGLGIAGFALIVGLSATVLRASLMAGFILLANLTGRTYTIIRALALAGVLMLMWNPYLLPYDVGFQLSFVATLGLILMAPQLERFVQWMPTWFKAREFLTATIATQLFVMPLLLYQIGEFSVVSVLVNVLVLPMVPAAMLLTFLVGLVGLVSAPLASFIALFAYGSLQYIIVLATWFASLPFAAYTVPPFPFWLVVVSYFLLAYWLWRYYLTSRVTTQAVEVENMSDWTIEEEEVVKMRVQKQGSYQNTGGEASSLRRDDASPPVFFR